MTSYLDQMDSVEDALSALRAGECILCVDDPERENEGDLICAAQFATTENVNLMASEGRGLICMPMSRELCKRLHFPQMVLDNEDNHETAFTVSVDYAETTTGISAAERGLTARKCAEADARPDWFRRPGHMFPLMARDRGVLEREGHTEATVDLCRMAHLTQCGLCCEVMRDDGTMMRTPELVQLSRKLGIKIISIKQIIDWRKRNDVLVRCVARTKLPTKFGDFTACAYINLLNGEHHVALVKGEDALGDPDGVSLGDGNDVLVRVHSECLTGDAFGSLRCDCGDQLEQAMRAVQREGRGVVLYMRQEGRGIGLVNKLRAYELQDGGMDTLDANLALGFEGDEREYYIGAQILRDLGVHTMRLLTNNPDKVYQLEDFGLEITQRVPIVSEPTEYDRRYLETKRTKMGHIL